MTVYYRNGYRNQLVRAVAFHLPERLWPDEFVELEYISLDAAGVLVISKGYAWDGASGPTADWPAKQIVVPSLIHDALCQLGRAGKMRSVADHRKHTDRLFYDLLRERGMNIIRAAIWYRGVRIGSLMDGDNKPIKEAS